MLITPDTIKPENKVELGSLEGSNHRVINKYSYRRSLENAVEARELIQNIRENVRV